MARSAPTRRSRAAPRKATMTAPTTCQRAATSTPTSSSASRPRLSGTSRPVPITPDSGMRGTPRTQASTPKPTTSRTVHASAKR